MKHHYREMAEPKHSCLFKVRLTLICLGTFIFLNAGFLTVKAQNCTGEECKLPDCHKSYEIDASKSKTKKAKVWPDGATGASDADDAVELAGITWSTSINEGLKRAKELKKPLFVFAEAKDCGYCKSFRTRILPRPVVAEYLSNNFVRSRIFVNSPDGKILQKHFGMDSWPTYLIFSPSGDLLADWGGCSDSLTALGFVNKAKLRMAKSD